MSEYRLAIVIDANGRPAISVMDQLTGKARLLEGAQRGVAGGAERMGGAMRRADTEMQSLGRTANQVKGFLGAVFGAAIVRDIVTTTTRIDGMSRTLEGVLGSSRAAQQGIAFVRAEADRLGVAFAPALDGYTKLAAAARGTPLAGNVNELTGAILQAGRAFNKSGEEINGAILAIEQMISKGTVSAEELRGQLGERIPGAFGLAAQAMGVTTAELSKMLEKGQVVASDFLPKFAAELSRSTAAAAGLNAASPAAELERIGNELQGITTDIGEGLFEGIGDGLKDLRQELAAINASDIGRGIGQALGAIARNADIAAVAMVAFAGPQALRAAIAGLQTLGVVARPLPAAVASAGAAFVAMNAPVVGSTVAITGWQLAAAKATAVGRGLFLLIGGWPGVLALAAAGTYALATAQTSAEQAADRARIAIDRLREATDANRVAALAAAQAELANIQALIARGEEAQRQLAEPVGGLAGTGVGRLISRLIGEGDPVEEAAGLDKLRQSFAELAAEISQATGLSAKVSQLFASFMEAPAVTGLLKALGVELGKTEQATTSAAGAAGDSADETRKYIDSLREQRATLGMSRAEQVRWEAAQRASKAATQDLSAEILREGEALARKIEETEAATEAERDAKRAADDLAQANARLAQEVARLEDPLRNVADAFRNFSQLERDLAQALMTPRQRALDQLMRDLQTVDEFIAAAFAAGPLPPEQVRALEDRVRQVTSNAHAVYQQSLQDIQAESERFWEGMGGEMGDALGEFTVQALFNADDIDEAWRNLGDSLVQTTKRAVAQMISELARLHFINPLLNSLLGTSLQTGGGMLGGLFSGQGGMLGGLFGNFFGGASASVAAGIPQINVIPTAAGGVRAAASAGGGAMSGIAAAIPIIGAILAGMQANNSLYDQGWRPGQGDKPAGAAYYSLATLTPTAMLSGVADRFLRGLGLDGRTASMLSGSAVVQRLFGRSAPQVTNSTTTLSLGPDGAGGGLSYRTLERGGLFRSDRRRTRSAGLDAEAQGAVEALFADVQTVMTESARALRGTAPEMIQASLRTVQEYDSKGKVKSTQYFVDVLGRSWEEANAEAATSRITAEAMIATIDSILGTTVQAAGDTIGQAGAEALERGAAQVAAGAAGAGAYDTLIKSVTDSMGEASAIAERWRDDAALLLEGAGFLLAAATDMRAGTALIADGTLTQITELVEDLQYEGESLIEAYGRLQASTQLYLGALGVLDGAMQVSTEEVVRFAAGAVEAMGGLDAAAEQLNVILTSFFTDAERAAYQLEAAQARVTDAAQALGVEGVTFENFRQRFEAARAAGLTPEEFAGWVRLGVALAAAHEAAQLLADATEDLGDAAGNAATGVTDMTEAANRALEAYQQLQEFIANLGGEITAFGREGMNEFVGTVQEVEDWIRRSTDEANALARAAGFQAASEETLAQIQLLGAARLGRAIAALDAETADLIDTLYGAADAAAEAEQDINRSNTDLAFAHQLANGFRQAVTALDPQRFQQAMQVAQNLFNLGWATGDDPLNIAERMGLPFDRFVADLGIDLRELNDAVNFDGLVQAARALGVELPELAARVGVNVGELSDSGSLLNDAFERVLGRVSSDQRGPIEEVLRRLETAAPGDRTAILGELSQLINSLPAELRSLFAPFLDDVDITPPEQEQVNATDRVTTAVNAGNALLTQILESIRQTTPPPKPGAGVDPPVRGLKSGDDSQFRPIAQSIEVSGSRQLTELQAISRGIRSVEGAVLRSNQLLSEIANETRREAERRSTVGA